MRHRDKCPHCAFMFAFRTRYQHAEGKKAKKEVFDDAAQSAIVVSSLIFSKLSPEQQARFVAEVIEKGSGGTVTTEIVNKSKLN